MSVCKRVQLLSSKKEKFEGLGPSVTRTTSHCPCENRLHQRSHEPNHQVLGGRGRNGSRGKGHMGLGLLCGCPRYQFLIKDTQNNRQFVSNTRSFFVL